MKAYAAYISLFIHKIVPQPVAADNELQPNLLAGTQSIFMYMATA